MLSISQAIGRNGKNNAVDIRKVETLLGRMGHLDLNKTDGATGYFGARLEDAVKSYQKDNGLKVDGSINPGGETIAQLGNQGATPKKPVPPKPPKVTKPKRPIPPDVPGSVPGKVKGKKKDELSDEELKKNIIKQWWFELIKKSIGR